MLIRLKNVNKTYSSAAGVTFRALSNVSLDFDNTGLVFLVGRSGSGKSTLMHVMGGLDRADGGDVLIGGQPLRGMKEAEIDSYRNTLVGFVFQEFNLIDTLTVFDNVRLALDMQSDKNDERVREVLERLEIGDKAHCKTSALSGGQRQRVALARALVKDPRIILADEPTGSLDSGTGDEVMRIFKELSRERLVVVVTHDAEKANEYGDRIIEMKDGCVYRDIKVKDGNGGAERPHRDVKFIRDTIVEVREPLNDEDASRIDAIIQASARKTYLSFETDVRKVKALFPGLREAVTEDDEQASFAQYVPKDEPTPEVSYVKSRLPVLKALKLGLINLKAKKGRLILTVLTALMAFVMFGLSVSFSGYDVKAGVKKTLVKEQPPFVTLLNYEGYRYDGVYRLPDGTDEALGRLTGQSVVSGYDQELLSFPLGRLIKSADGFIETDTPELFAPMLYGVKAESPDEIVVTEAVAREILVNKMVRASGIEDMIGKSVVIKRREYRISGILDTDLLYYDTMAYDELYPTLENDCLNGLNRLYVKPGFKEAYKSVFLNDTAGTLIVTQSSESDPKSAAVQLGYSPNDTLYVGRKVLDELEIDADALEDFNAAEHTLILQKHDGTPIYASADRLTLAEDDNAFLLPAAAADKIFPQCVYTTAVYASSSGAKSVRALVDYAYDSGLYLAHPCVTAYEQVLTIQSVLRYVLLGASLVFCLLVILLLFNFISTSIRLTKKQIGILRALGARKFDTFLIYMLEGIAVVAFSLLFTFLVFAVGVPAFNAALSRSFYFSVIIVGVKEYITVALLALAVAAVSVLIPLRKFNKISPIEAITDK